MHVVWIYGVSPSSTLMPLLYRPTKLFSSFRRRSRNRTRLGFRFTSYRRRRCRSSRKRIKKETWTCYKIWWSFIRFYFNLFSRSIWFFTSYVCLFLPSFSLLSAHSFLQTTIECIISPCTGDNPSTLLSFSLLSSDVVVSLGTSDTILLSTTDYVPNIESHTFSYPANMLEENGIGTGKRSYMGMLCYKKYVLFSLWSSHLDLGEGRN